MSSEMITFTFLLGGACFCLIDCICKLIVKRLEKKRFMIDIKSNDPQEVVEHLKGFIAIVEAGGDSGR